MHQNFSAFGGIFCFIAFIGFIVAILTIVFKSAKKASANAVPPRRTATTIVDDGFWIDSCAASPASLLRYHYWASGQQHFGEATYHPGPDGRHFVYTGMRPDQVEITGITPAADDSSSFITPTIVDNSPTFGHSHSAFSSSSRYPSAY